MNILQLCKAAERYEMICMMNLTEDEIKKAAERYGVPFDDLYFFIESGAQDSNYRGEVFSKYVSKNKNLVEWILLNSDFYEIWDYSVNN